MIPNVRMDLRDGFTIESVPSKTYRLISGGEKTGRIQGKRSEERRVGKECRG